MLSGICTWITSAPQSASWRAAVGPARTWVRSRTRKRDNAWEAGTWGILRGFLLRGAELGHHAADDPLEERGIGRVLQDHEVAQPEAARELGAVAFEHGPAAAVAEEEARL